MLVDRRDDHLIVGEMHPGCGEAADTDDPGLGSSPHVRYRRLPRLFAGLAYLVEQRLSHSHDPARPNLENPRLRLTYQH